MIIWDFALLPKYRLTDKIFSATLYLNIGNARCSKWQSVHSSDIGILRAVSVLAELRKRYQHIKVYRVLAYMPKLGDTDTYDTIVPEGIETTYPRYAIIKRNKWMIDHSDYVIAYVTHTFGGAYQAVVRAKRKKITVISVVK